MRPEVLWTSTEQDLMDLATGLVKVMGEYDKMGIYSFNMNFFTGAKNR